ncbi:2OG-Fe(II) oxygenase [Marinobacterium weihaiense]|uniref:2OG-Fe(II) oxygenase n=1 Tax=Marinobacterium weihaiense TaxID=2851016 RepID=A0ABS6MAK4_9GAMM|nr:2OG-Fe(II) oxygenase [Marinobacterium weihaiense]MBV0933318.1 2OG-Fe(II) oxygenase [Marinobacterium weihaiense]
MYSPPELPIDLRESLFDRIADTLVDKGYIILPSALPETLGRALYEHLDSFSPRQMQQAGIGREQDHQLKADIRRDQIRWLGRQHPAEADYLDWMSDLREGLNRRLFMGLFDYEAHFAHYRAGAFYKRHLDAFRGQTNRVLTTVLYLNPDWDEHAGGELLIWPEPDSETPIERVVPRMGTLVIFLSEQFPHEVLPAATDRYSIAGWFRVNASINNQIDPPR